VYASEITGGYRASGILGSGGTIQRPCRPR
jgi:hypothetical protein